MKIDSIKFGMACGMSTALLWIACSIFVMVMPSAMLSISGDMLHMELLELGWHLTWGGVIKGLVAWIVSAGLFGWLLAAIYNRLTISEPCGWSGTSTIRE